MSRVRADTKEYHKNGIVACSTVTVDGFLRFLVQVRTYIDQSGNEKWFLSFPRRKQGGQWEDILRMDEELKEEITREVLGSLKEKVASEFHFPDIENVRMTLTNTGNIRTGKMIVRAVATVEIAGIAIKGITVKETDKGMIVNMPQYQTASGEYRDAVYGCVKKAQDMIREAVLDEYEKMTEKNVPKFGTKEGGAQNGGSKD